MVIYLRARHDMVRHVRSRLVMLIHVMVQYMQGSLMHIMVWNVGEMHAWV
jgi:hypothetical protein